MIFQIEDSQDEWRSKGGSANYFYNRVFKKKNSWGMTTTQTIAYIIHCFILFKKYIKSLSLSLSLIFYNTVLYSISK